MAEESEQGGKNVAGADVRSDAFGRMLGPDWVEVEPGIYEHRPLRLTEPGPLSGPAVETPLHEELLDSLPRPVEEVDAEHSTSAPTEDPPLRRPS